MAFTAITTTEIEAGKANTNPLWEKVRLNFNDHESRLTTVENSTSSFLNIPFEVQGRVKAATAILPIRINFNSSISSARLVVEDAGSAGTCEVDLKYGAAGGPFTSIFSTRPTVAFGAGDLGISSNAVLTSNPYLATAGNYLILDIISVQTGQKGLVLYVEYLPT